MPLEFDESDANVRAAAEVFYRRGANPRDIRGQLSDVLFFGGGKPLTSAAILTAAKNFAPSADARSAIYADLWAVRVASQTSYLPWSTDPAGYEYPPHLDPLVDHKTGDIDAEKLDATLDAMKAHANV